MEVRVEQHGSQRAVIRLVGQVEGQVADTLRTALKEAAANGLIYLAIDLGAVNLIDSRGLGALISGLRAVFERGGALVLCTVGPQTRMILELTRLHHLLPIYDDVTSALASFPS